VSKQARTARRRKGHGQDGEKAETVAELRIPTKPAMHSNLKPATYSDLKPASVPI
jgi:hypothetical protein